MIYITIYYVTIYSIYTRYTRYILLFIMLLFIAYTQGTHDIYYYLLRYYL